MKEIRSAILASDLERLNILLNANDGNDLEEKEINQLIKLSKDKGILKIEATLLLKYKQVLHSYSQKDKEEIVISLIHELSDDLYCSIWNDGVEEQLWSWGTGVSEPDNTLYRSDEVKRAAKLAVDLGKEIGFWAEWNDEKGKPLTIPIQEWNRRLNK